MNDWQSRRAFRNYILEQLDRYENYGDDFCGDFCQCSSECKCYGRAGTELCLVNLINYYGGEDYADS